METIETTGGESATQTESAPVDISATEAKVEAKTETKDEEKATVTHKPAKKTSKKPAVKAAPKAKAKPTKKVAKKAAVKTAAKGAKKAARKPGKGAGHKAQCNVHKLAWKQITAMAKEQKIRDADVVRDLIYKALKFKEPEQS